jgi:hypothetical protein
MNVLEQFKRFEYIWSTDKDAELAAFNKTNPMLLDYKTAIQRYEVIEEGIKDLPEYYDVGPISLLSGQNGTDTYFNVKVANPWPPKPSWKMFYWFLHLG